MALASRSARWFKTKKKVIKKKPISYSAYMWQDEQTAVTDMNVVTTAHPHTGRLYVYANPFIRLVRLEGGLEYLRGGWGVEYSEEDT